MRATPKYEYPPCPDCGDQLTINVNQVSLATANQETVFSVGMCCACGYKTNDPPHVVKREWQNTLFFVRVPETLQRTDAGLNRACSKIPFQWRRAYWGFRFIEERALSGARWWLFEPLQRRNESV